MDAIVGRVFAVRRCCRDEGEFSVENERVKASGEAGFCAGELTDLSHGAVPFICGRKNFRERRRRDRRARHSGRRRLHR